MQLTPMRKDTIRNPTSERYDNTVLPLAAQLNISPTAAAEVAIHAVSTGHFWPETHPDEAFLAWMDATR